MSSGERGRVSLVKFKADPSCRRRPLALSRPLRFPPRHIEGASATLYSGPSHVSSHLIVSSEIGVTRGQTYFSLQGSEIIIAFVVYFHNT